MKGILDLDSLSTYYDLETGRLPETDLLEEKLAHANRINENNVLISNSSLGLLRQIIEKVASGSVTIYIPDYFEFQGMCRNPELIQRADDWRIPDITVTTDAVLVSTPNNPTGIYESPMRLVRQAKGRLVIVDEAYIEYVGNPYSVAHFVRDNPNLVVLRTFSKFYGMKGLGYCIASQDILSALKPAEVSRDVRLKAQALIMHPKTEIARCDVDNRREQLEYILKTRGSAPVDSRTNFIMAKNHASLFDYLDKRGVRSVNLDNTPGLENQGYCRIAVPSYDKLMELARRLE